MQFLKEHGYGGVIIWSLDLDDKTGDVCKEGPFPIFNAAKRELLNLPDHLLENMNINNSLCLEENRTMVVEHLQSKMTRNKQSTVERSIRIELIFFSFRFLLPSFVFDIS